MFMHGRFRRIDAGTKKLHVHMWLTVIGPERSCDINPGKHAHRYRHDSDDAKDDGHGRHRGTLSLSLSHFVVDEENSPKKDRKRPSQPTCTVCQGENALIGERRRTEVEKEWNERNQELRRLQDNYDMGSGRPRRYLKIGARRRRDASLKTQGGRSPTQSHLTEAGKKSISYLQGVDATAWLRRADLFLQGLS